MGQTAQPSGEHSAADQSNQARAPQYMEERFAISLPDNFTRDSGHDIFSPGKIAHSVKFKRGKGTLSLGR
jgi:hypothetical protein